MPFRASSCDIPYNLVPRPVRRTPLARLYTPRRGRLRKPVLIKIALTAVIFSTGAAIAQTTGADLAKAKNCLACHQIDTKRIGPPFRSVAQRYGAQEDVADYLARIIRQGGRGAWGVVPMPAQSHVSPAEAKELVEWILSLKQSEVEFSR